MGLNLLRIHCSCSHITSRLVSTRPFFLISPQIHLRENKQTKKKPKKLKQTQKYLLDFFNKSLHFNSQAGISMTVGGGTNMTDYHKISCLRKKSTGKTKCEKYQAKLSGCSTNGTVSTNLVLTSNFFILNLLQASSFSAVTVPIWFHLDEHF